MEGKVGSIDSDSAFFWALPVLSGGDYYAYDFSDGVLYDEDLDQVGVKHEAPTALVDGGVYELDEEELTYYRWDETKPLVVAVGRLRGGGFIAAGDGRVYVLNGDELLTYS